MKKQIIVRAWEIAKAAATQFGGTAREYIAAALRQAWAETRAPKKVTVELRQSNSKSKTWIAAIVGKHPVYKFERKFVNAIAWGSYTWDLEAGDYEVCENSKRYFIRVENGDYREIVANEIAA